MQCIFRSLVLAGIMMLGWASVAAGEGPQSPVKSVSLLSGWRSGGGSDEIHVIGIRIQLRDEWKTFWRAPGSAGLPPRFDWSKSRNLETASLLWPVPSILRDGEYVFLGYEKEVVFPVMLQPANPGEEISLFVNFEFAVCSEICLPTGAELSAVLPARDTVHDPTIAEVLKDLRENFRIGSAGENPRCKFTPSELGHEVSMEYSVPFPESRKDTHVALEYPDYAFQFGDAAVRSEAGKLAATSEMRYYGSGAAAIDRSAIRSTVILGGTAIEFQGCVGL